MFYFFNCLNFLLY